MIQRKCANQYMQHGESQQGLYEWRDIALIPACTLITALVTSFIRALHAPHTLETKFLIQRYVPSWGTKGGKGKLMCLMGRCDSGFEGRGKSCERCRGRGRA